MQKSIMRRLLELGDQGYREFQCLLMPTVSPDTVIGVRTPDLRKLAKEISGTPEGEEFLSVLPHKFYDENNLHGFLICCMNDYDEAVERLDHFLPHIDNWATCDLISPKCFGNHADELYDKIVDWIASDKVYTIRFGIDMLIRWFLGDHFRPEQHAMIAELNSTEYYVNTAAAWYFATALATQMDETLPYFTEKKLGAAVHNRAIRKALESQRISEDDKAMLRTLRIKALVQ